MPAYIFCHCNATPLTQSIPLHTPNPPVAVGSSVVRAVALFFRICCHFSLSHSNTGLVWPNPDPAAGFCPVPVDTSPLSASSYSPPAFNSISRVTFHCMHRFIIAKMENSAAADGFPSVAIASHPPSLFLLLLITLGHTLCTLCIRRFEQNRARGFMFMFVLNILQVFRLACVLLSHFRSPSSLCSPTSWMDYACADCRWVRLSKNASFSFGIAFNPTRKIIATSTLRKWKKIHRKLYGIR